MTNVTIGIDLGATPNFVECGTGHLHVHTEESAAITGF